MEYMTQILAGEILLNPTLYRIIEGNLLLQQAIFMVMLMDILLNTLQQAIFMVMLTLKSLN